MIRKLWLLVAQATAVGVGLFLALKAVDPDLWRSQSEVVAIKEASLSSLAPGGSRVALSGFRAATQKASPSVVNIYTSKAVPKRRYLEDPLLRRFLGDGPEAARERQASLGSGVIVANQGYILTNNHVVDGADEIAVLVPDGRTMSARVVGTDPDTDTDLAVLKVDVQDLHPVTFGNSDALQTGDVVLAIGNPFGVGQTVTMGIVSATGRSRLGINTYENFIQTDAAINPGNSGGALVDIEGNLVGVNTAIFSESGGSQGIGFAIPASLARQVMDELIRHGKVVRGGIGVEVGDVTNEVVASLRLKSPRGALVGRVLRRGPADIGGLRASDVITSVGEKSIDDASALTREVATLEPGKNVEIAIFREGQEQKLNIKVGSRPPSRSLNAGRE